MILLVPVVYCSWTTGLLPSDWKVLCHFCGGIWEMLHLTHTPWLHILPYCTHVLLPFGGEGMLEEGYDHGSAFPLLFRSALPIHMHLLGIFAFVTIQILPFTTMPPCHLHYLPPFANFALSLHLLPLLYQMSV